MCFLFFKVLEVFSVVCEVWFFISLLCSDYLGALLLENLIFSLSVMSLACLQFEVINGLPFADVSGQVRGPLPPSSQACCS